MSTEPPLQVTALQACARVQMPCAADYVQWLVTHLQQEGVQTSAGSTPHHQRLVMDSVGTLELNTLAEDMLECTVWPVDAPMLALVKMSLLEHAQEFLTQQQRDPQQLSIAWSDAHAEDAQTTQPGFARLRVLQRTDITPQMRRFRLQVQHLNAVVQGGLHVRLLLPVPGQAVQWPVMGCDGRLQYPDDASALPQRIYTIVHSNEAQGWLEIDMLRHGNAASASAAPGTFWAEHAQPGDELGVITPAGGRLQTADSMVLVADNCALPALVRQLQMLPPHVQVQVIAMAEDDSEIRPLPLPAQHTLHWLIQPSTETLLQAVQQLDWSHPERLWAACGDAQAKALRHWLREQPKPVRSQISSYWR